MGCHFVKYKIKDFVTNYKIFRTNVVEANVLCLQFMEHLKGIIQLFFWASIVSDKSSDILMGGQLSFVLLSPWMSYYFGVASFSFLIFWFSAVQLCLGVVFFAFILFWIYITHILFICLSITGHVGCFYILANIYNGAVNVGGCIYLFKLVFLFSLHKYPELEYLDHMVILNFLRNSILFFIVLVLIYIPTSSVGKIPLLQTLFRNTCYSLLFW